MYFVRNSHWIAALLAVGSLFSLGRLSIADDASDSKEKAKAHLATLRSDAPGAEKALACKGLAVHGTAEAVPDLAKLLSDDKLASWARIALESIPGKEADEAFRTAAEKLQGRLLIGVVNSIGVRRDAEAVEVLSGLLKKDDVDVASSAAVALGKIGNDAAIKTLRPALAGAKSIRSAAAEGCILCAERLMADDKGSAAAELYDEVRKAEVPHPRVLEATRGAIVSRKAEGIPLLLEQLRARDRGLFQIGLSVARELGGEEITNALAKETETADADRSALILYALADRELSTIPQAVLEAAENGQKPVRIAAFSVIGKLGNATSVSTLLPAATDSDAEVAQAARTALAELPGEKVNAEFAAMLPKAEGKMLPVLIEIIGQRRIDATSALIKALDNSDAAVRIAALTALGETVSPKQLSVLVTRAVSTKNADEAKAAQQALRAAAVRMADREAAATEVAAALPKASVATRVNILETLAAVGGTKALDAMTAAVKSNEEELRDAGSRLLGEWMTVDAGPNLLDLAKSAPTEKYQVRALRGYIRLARQFVMSDKDRADMCQKALAASNRADEQKLTVAVLERYPSLDTLAVAIKAMQVTAIKEEATRATMLIAQKLGDKAEAQKLVAKSGIEPVKLEIVKAQYGAGEKQKDVTAILKKQAGEYPLIVLPGANYTASFGGDPAPGVTKQLKVQYKMNGKTGEATFAENASVYLPMPK